MNKILLLVNKRMLFCILCLIISSVSFGQISPQTYSAPGTYNFTVPSGVASITVQAWGAGENGKNDTNYGGGGGGAYAESTFNVTALNSYTIVVGSHNYIGENSSLAVSTSPSTLIVKAEGGGQNAYHQGGRASGSIGNIKYSGGDGHRSTSYYGGGGGSAGSNGNGINANLYMGGNSGNVADGVGGDGSKNFPTAGTSPGGGGGEGRNSSGIGGDGQVIISWTCATSAGTLSGNQYICTYGTKNTTFTSTISGGTWSSSNNSVATVNLTTGVITSVGGGIATITYTVGGSGGCTTYTATRTVYVSNGPGAGPNSLSGSNSQCQNSTTTYTITPDVYSSSYVWLYSGSGATITPAADGLSASVTFSATATAGNINVQSVNGCGNGGGGKYLYVSIASSSAGGTLPSNVSGCANTYIANIALSGQVGTPIRWESSTDNFATAPTTIVTTSNNINISGLTQTTYYRAVVQNSPCSGISYSSVCTATISNNTASTASSSPTVCSGTSMTNITHTTTGATGISNNNVTGANGLPAGVKAIWASNNITISGTPTGTPGTYNYSIPLNGGCGNVSATGSIIVSTASVVPTTITVPTTICLGSSTSLTVSGGTLGAGATAKWYSGSCGGTLVGSGNTISVSPTITTTYYVRYEGSCNSTACISTTVTVNPSLSNNNLSFSSGNSGQVNATPAENANALLNAPSGTYFSNVAFASYGTPNGAPPNFTINSSCHATTSQSVTEGYLLGNSTATIPATNGVFGDPCNGTMKKLYVLASYIEPICNGSAITIAGSIPSGGTGIYAYLWESSTTSATSGFSAATGTNNTINYTSGSISQTTWFRRTVTSCTLSSTSAILMIKVNATNIWNGSVWSNGTPTLSDKIVFSGNYPPASDPNVDIVGCSCKVSGSTNVVFKTGRTLKITNELIVQSTGTLTFENGASLVQINDTPSTANSGNIIYNRDTTPITNFDYTYWSSPVTFQSLYNVSPDTFGDKFYSFDSGINNWRQENSENIMAIGTGYIIRGPQYLAVPKPPGLYTASFIGEPNNGIKYTPIGVAGNSNLIGNPYPSALDADSFLIANAGVIDGTIYFWTHNTHIGIGVSNPGSGLYAYSSDDYAAYNLTGGVATLIPAISLGLNNNAPSGKIASGQAFFTTSIASGNAVFNNSMRVGVGSILGDNFQFFKNASIPKAVTTFEKDRLWLNLYNDQDAFKQTLVGYISGATNEFDRAFDGESFNANAFLDFYSIYQDKNLVIQGRALPFVDTDEVPLGYSSTIVGGFKISIGQVDGLLVNKDVFLEDKLLNITHNLKDKPYSFTTEKGVFNNRFIIRYTNKTLVTDDFEDMKYGVLISNKNKEIEIKSSVESIDKIFIYDFSGKQLYEKTTVDSNEYKVLNLISSDQALIIKVVLQNGQIVSEKIIF